MKTIINFEDFLHQNMDDFAKFAMNYTCVIFTFNNYSGFDMVGNGLFFSVDNNYFLLTSSHVLEKNDISQYLIACREYKVVIRGERFETKLDENSKNFQIDYAIIKLENEIVNQIKTDFLFLELENLGINKQLETKKVFLFGIPQSRIEKHYVKTNEYVVEPLYMITKEANANGYNKRRAQKETHILVDFTKKMYKSGTNQKNEIPRLEGMSGSGLWLIDDLFYRENENPKLKLVGIVQGYRTKDAQVIVSTRIDVISEFLRTHLT